ncbi:MAG: hypothetical protein ACKO3T_16125, partial [Planctomycetaceae bacterium]
VGAVLLLVAAWALPNWVRYSTAQLLPLVVLGAAIAAGELLQLRPVGRGALPLSYAFFLVAVHVGSSPEVPGTVVVAVVAAALLLGWLISEAPDLGARTTTLIVRAGAFTAALLVYRLALGHLAVDRISWADPRWNALLALLLAGAAAIITSDLLTAIRHPGTPLGLFSFSAASLARVSFPLPLAARVCVSLVPSSFSVA